MSSYLTKQMGLINVINSVPYATKCRWWPGINIKVFVPIATVFISSNNRVKMGISIKAEACTTKMVPIQN